MKKYSFMLLILIGISTVVFGQDIKAHEKPEKNQNTKSSSGKKVMVSFH